MIFLFLLSSQCSNPCCSSSPNFDSYAPGFYFPDNKGNKSILCTSKSTPQTNSTYQTAQPYSNTQYPNQPISNQTYPNAQFPNQINTAPSAISPFYTQPPGNNQFATQQCDSSMESDKYKNCITNAIKSLKSIIANCKRTLGDDAPECCVDEKCLETLKKKKDKCTEEMVEKVVNKKKDSLQEFLSFLKNEIQSREKRHRKRRGGYRNEYRKESGDFDYRDKEETNCKDPCSKKEC